jgi:hypothetical protein
MRCRAQVTSRTVLRVLRSAWVLVLLVLLHGFGPALHLALHDHHHAALHALDDAFGCSCAAHAAEQELLRCGGPDGVPKASVADGDHDCEFCAELQRGHGLPLPTSLPTAAVAPCSRSPIRVAQEVVDRSGPALPSARAPPRLLSCGSCCA